MKIPLLGSVKNSMLAFSLASHPYFFFFSSVKEKMAHETSLPSIQVAGGMVAEYAHAQLSRWLPVNQALLSLILLLGKGSREGLGMRLYYEHMYLQVMEEKLVVA